jgi:hypothetical protein
MNETDNVKRKESFIISIVYVALNFIVSCYKVTIRSLTPRNSEDKLNELDLSQKQRDHNGTLQESPYNSKLEKSYSDRIKNLIYKKYH